MPDTSPSTGTLRWSHVALNCTDPRATATFYTELFGFRTARVVPLGEDEIVFLRHGDVYLELFRVPAGTGGRQRSDDGPTTPGVARHLAFQTDDLDTFLSRAGDAVPIALGPLSFDNFIPGWRSVWLTDPDGLVVEVSQGYRDA
jgi:glyoxylase I family protein